MTAYVVQADPIHENSINYFSANLGFYRIGYHVERFKLSELPSLEIDVDTPVFGGMESISEVLPNYVGLEYYPDEIKNHMYRDVRSVRVEELQSGDFFKPLPEDHKLFSPFVKDDSLQCKLTIAKIPSDHIVLTTQAVEFLSEFRVYVLEGKILDICFYKGEPSLFPDPITVKDMVSKVSHHSIAFGLDVGVLSTGETAVIEMNDFCCLGNYGLKAQQYALCIAKRWTQVYTQFNE